jgi:hypothetical protein
MKEHWWAMQRALVGNAKSIGGQCKEHWWAMPTTAYLVHI